ncbi:carbamoyl-phosphate synthase subunit L [Leptospira perolatii]|uniref:Carbamoyl-phosphate synthase subunit L n=1 Tax=Leptospira perolatii TaxID=2023191 RepID=A0A2M9ZIS6_9LEPT|nr:carboxyl transferase domain-containing protein [Leptospira perolatii]PJZ68611.1 carbamoyl-phosphate synthase subunit L [Leptospira perolatii]PJZ71958.1 carbamoyl-phosphate synthase subunit L [Leptospira perolatii]
MNNHLGIATAEKIEQEFSRDEMEKCIAELRKKNLAWTKEYTSQKVRSGRLQKVLVANRGEIAKRFFLALHEEGIPTVAVVADPDKGQSWFEFADEVVYIGEAGNYTNAKILTAAVLETGSNAVYPGYGFLSEDFRFVDTLKWAAELYNTEIIFMGPKSSVMKRVGNKLDARRLAAANGIPLFEASGPLSEDSKEAHNEAERIGYPVMIKLDAGGGGKGMLVVRSKQELGDSIQSAVRIGKTSYGNGTFYLEKYVERPAHFEVQIFNGTAVGIRKCAVQRRNQKIIEESGETFLDVRTQLQLLSSAEKIADVSGYSDACGAGTVEFLFDREQQKFGFLEMNTRLQVEYPVTDQSLGIDLVKWQIFLFDGRENEIQYSTVLKQRFAEKSHSIQCRIYAEDPFQNYSPSPGRIQEIELPTFNGVRSDFGFKRGDLILGEYDPMVGKLIAKGKDRGEALMRMERALSELYIRGITTNIEQLLQIVRDSIFRSGDYDNRLLDDNPQLVTSDYSLSSEAIVYACVSETIREAGNMAAETFRERDLPKLLYSEESEESPCRYSIYVNEKVYSILVIRIGIEEFLVFGDGIGSRKIRVSRPSEDGREFLVKTKGRFVSVRIDCRPNFYSIRFSDSFGKLRYARLKIEKENSLSRIKNDSVLRSPFQGTFVKFCENPQTGKSWKEGEAIRKGDPILVISAMKMETLLRSPSNGKLEYLAEHGEEEKLIRGKSPSGFILGRSFAEGEILAQVSGDSIPNQTEKQEPVMNSNVASSDFVDRNEANYSEALYSIWQEIPVDILKKVNPFFEEKARYLLVAHASELRELLCSWILGFSQGKETRAKLTYLLNHIEVSRLEESTEEKAKWEDFLLQTVRFSVLLRRLFSSDFGSSHSHFGELQRLLAEWDHESLRPILPTSKLLSRAFSYYKVGDWNPSLHKKEQAHAFAFLLCAYRNLREGMDLLAKVLEKFVHLAPKVRSWDFVLHQLLALEEREREPKMEGIIRQNLSSRRRVSGPSPEGVPTISRRHLSSYVRFSKDPWSLLGLKDQKSAAADFLRSFQEETDLLPQKLGSTVTKEIEKRIHYWSEKGKVRRLSCPIQSGYMYLLEYEDTSEYLLIKVLPRELLKLVKESASWDSHFYPLEEYCIESAALLQGALKLCSVDSLRLELMVEDSNEGNLDIQIVTFENNYEQIMRSASSVIRFFLDARYSSLLLTANFKPINRSQIVNKTYSFFFREGKLRIDLIGANDIRFPYTKEKEVNDSKLYAKGKWPVERWVEEAFDIGAAAEITIPGIDFEVEGTTSSEKKNIRVGAKIYLGEIDGKEALFFLKDSRVAGGATGDLEGQKYIAASYIAYRKDIPFYVWNDGAGANIKEGMVSLNRAAEGFFMNALLSNRVSAEEFKAAIYSHNDPKLIEIISSLEADPRFEFTSYVRGQKPKSCFVVAVGVGSSTGLDVYGSSQASLQILLDEEQSYRVLTGATVIESVTGEKFTNYEIGGAKVMGRGTGTVDLVAQDKIELLSFIKRIQNVFARTNGNWHLPRKLQKDEKDNVISESTLRAYSKEFLPIKETYSGSGSLVSGISNLGLSPVLILGPRTQHGFHSFSSLIKAKESVQIARKTGAGILLVYGSKWFRSTHLVGAEELRARKDFQNQLHTFPNPIVHILKHPEGFRLPELYETGDAWILIRKKRSDNQITEIEKGATFAVETEEEAFSIASELFYLLGEKNIQNFEYNTFAPEIPPESTRTYDMREVIKFILDRDSFLEFHKNDAGTSLLTGLGRLNGKTVGIIADQPMLGEAPDAQGTEKFRVFMEFLSRRNLPLLMLSDAPGFVPGTKQERLRIQQIGGESLDVNVLSSIPVVSIVLRQNYGGRQIHAFSGFLRPGVSYYAQENSTLGVMGASSAFDLFEGANVQKLSKEGKNIEIESLRTEFLQKFQSRANASQDANSTGVLDGLYTSYSELREVAISGMNIAERKVANWNRLKFEDNSEHLFKQSVASRNVEEWEKFILP